MEELKKEIETKGFPKFRIVKLRGERDPRFKNLTYLMHGIVGFPPIYIYRKEVNGFNPYNIMFS